MLRNRFRFLGGVSSFALFAPDTGAGAGGGDGGAAAGTRDAGAAAGAGGDAAAGADAGKGAAAGADAGGGGARAGADAGAGASKDAGAGSGRTTLAGGADPSKAGAAAAAPQTFPDNWREQLAGDDKAKLNKLQRYASPKALWDSLDQLQGKISAGELKAPIAPPAEGAKPEEIAAWRKENGLPENAGAFVTGLKLPDGMVPGKQDEPLLSSFSDLAQKSNWNQEQFNQAVGWYYQLSDQLSAQREEADGTFHTQAMTELMQEWGPKEFKGNQAAVGNFVAMFPEDLRAQMLLARTPDGHLLGDHPLFNRAALMLAKEINPASTLLPNVGGGGLAGVDTRIAEIEGIMKDPAKSNQYWHGEGGAKMQAELRTLYEARDKIKGREAA